MLFTAHWSCCSFAIHSSRNGHRVRGERIFHTNAGACSPLQTRRGLHLPAVSNNAGSFSATWGFVSMRNHRQYGQCMRSADCACPRRDLLKRRNILGHFHPVLISHREGVPHSTTAVQSFGHLSARIDIHVYCIHHKASTVQDHVSQLQTWRRHGCVMLSP